VRREAFDTFALRVADDLAMLRRESQTAVITTTGVRETAIKALSEGVAGQNTENEIRFGKIVGTHAKLIGGIAIAAFIFPLITGMLIYLLDLPRKSGEAFAQPDASFSNWVGLRKSSAECRRTGL
jgi:hypothetical protein